jgi:hypothetical protein
MAKHCLPPHLTLFNPPPVNPKQPRFLSPAPPWRWLNLTGGKYVNTARVLGQPCGGTMYLTFQTARWGTTYVCYPTPHDYIYRHVCIYIIMYI